MGEIRSAAEIAREKVQELGEPTEEERLSWKYVPDGEKLAVRYLNQGSNLVAELSQYEEKVRKHIVKGATDILIRNITLPTHEAAKKKNRQAMDGLKTLKSDKVGVENVFSQIRRVFNHYQEQGEQQRGQAYQSLKAEFEAKVQQAVQQQMGPMMGVKIDVERQPQFQEEWHRIQNQLDSQYLTLLAEYREELRAIA